MRTREKPSKMPAPRNYRSGWAPTILAVLATFLPALPAQAADVRLNRLSVTQIELTGGTGRETWHLRYGTHATFYEAQLVPAEGDRTWFSHGNWLRLIDTKKGLVIGRWRFPCRIASLTPMGTKVQVELRENTSPGGQEFIGQAVTFDPASPSVPPWPPFNFMTYRLPYTEAQAGWPAIDISGAAGGKKIPPDQAKQLLPELEEAVRRDPLTPWFRVLMGKALWDVNDPRASKVFQEAIEVPPPDFTELLWISAWLDDVGQPELARAAFERGYGDFWQRGNNPRFLFSWFARGRFYNPRGEAWGNPATELGRELIERTYRLSPNADWASVCWHFYADYLQKNGRGKEAELWRVRAREAEEDSLSPWNFGAVRVFDTAFRVAFSAGLAAIVYGIILLFRYRPQRMLDTAAKRRESEPSAGFAPSDVRTWTAPEQIGFLVFVVIGWGLGFWKIGPPVEGLFRAFLALYYVLPFALLFLLILYLWHWQRHPAAARKGEPNAGATEFSSLDTRRWGWGRRLGFIALFLAAGTFGYFKVDTEAGSFEHLLGSFYVGIAAVLLYLLVGYLIDLPQRQARGAAGRVPGFSWFNTVYWSWPERIGFCAIVVTAWLAIGLGQGMLAAILPFFSSPGGWGAGNFGGPASVQFLETRLSATKDRDLFLAIAYQQQGDVAKAEQLYRRLPEFAQGWNNLGVMLKEAGKDQEARAAFEKALQLDPNLAEAALNLGRPPRTLWTELHQKYLPGHPMIAPPSRDQCVRAFAGAPLSGIYLRSVEGPFTGVGLEVFGEEGKASRTGRVVSTAVLVFAIGLLFLVPSREVTQAPGRYHWVWETLFPGTASAWRGFGGLVLAAWCFFVLQVVILASIGTPYQFIWLGTPALTGIYGVPVSQEDVLRFINPSWVWLYLAPAVLFLSNLVMVLRSRRA